MIEFDTFRTDIDLRQFGGELEKDVLHVRGRLRVGENLWVEYFCPIWIEEGYAPGIDPVQDAKDLIAATILRKAEERRSNEV